MHPRQWGTPMSRMFCATLTAMILTAGAPVAAHAALPFTAGSGSHPAVAVGYDGSAHVAWTTTGSNAQVGYCRVGPGAEACSRTELLSFPGATAANLSGRATVSVPSPGEVVIVAGCRDCPGSPGPSTNKAYRWLSTDNGSTFVAAQIGREFELHGTGTWTEGASLFVASNSNSVMAQTMPTLVGAATPIAPAGYFYDGAVVQLPGTSTLVAASNDLSAVGYRVYGGGTLTAGAINNPGNWGALKSLAAPESANSATTLNAGPNGVLLAYRSQAPAAPGSACAASTRAPAASAGRSTSRATPRSTPAASKCSTASRT